MGLADLSLKPRDSAFTVPEVYQWPSHRDMNLCRWFHQAPYLPRCLALAEMPHMLLRTQMAGSDQHAEISHIDVTLSK